MEQPRLLTGGQLHPHQLVALRWLVSLYDNHLNGILADEVRNTVESKHGKELSVRGGCSTGEPLR